jgi:hypothetical protein
LPDQHSNTCPRCKALDACRLLDAAAVFRRAPIGTAGDDKFWEALRACTQAVRDIAGQHYTFCERHGDEYAAAFQEAARKRRDENRS